MSDQWIRNQARGDFARARRRALWEAVVDVLKRRPSDLLPLEEVRSRLNVRGSHYLGLQHVPLATFSARAGDWRQGDEIVLVCRSGARSSQAARILVAAGFQRVMNLAGGMLAYHRAGLPVIRG